MTAPMEPLEVRSSPGSGLRWATGMAVAFTAFMVFLAGGCFVGLLTQPIDTAARLSALVIGCLAAFGVSYGVRGVRATLALRDRVVIARLDADGLHLHEGAGIADLPPDVAWTTIPWSWVTAVSRTSFDLAAVKRMGTDVPFDCVRFALADDDLLATSHFDRPAADVVATWLGLTPRQTRLLLLGATDAPEHLEVLDWVRVHRPDLPVLEGRVAPWTTKASSDPWSGRPRVAVVGAHGRLGRRVVEALVAREDVAPVAIVRNEGHRAALERLGAEVRMLDLEEQDVAAVAAALRGCAAVVHTARASPAGVVEGARRAGVQRLLLVPGGWKDDDVVALVAGSGLQWTAFRPSLLTDETPSGEVELGLDVTPGPVPRADLAQVIAAAIRDEDSVGEAWPIAGVRSPSR